MNRQLHRLIVESPALKGAAYRVMLAIAWNATSTNECSISISDLAANAQLTKKSVISALHLLTIPHTSVDSRSILTKTRHGRGVGIPNTYLISLELLRDLNKHSRYAHDLPSPDSGTKNLTTPDSESPTDADRGNVGTPVRGEQIQTLRHQIDQNETPHPRATLSTASRPLSKREVNKIRNAHAKQAAQDILAMLHGRKPISWMSKQHTGEMQEDAAPLQVSDSPSPEAVDEVSSPETREYCAALVDGPSEQSLFPRRYSLRTNGGAQTLPSSAIPPEFVGRAVDEGRLRRP